MQKAAQALDKVRGPLGEISNRAVPNLAIEAIGFAQKDAGRRAAIADAFDKHGYVFAQKNNINMSHVKDKYAILVRFTWLHSEGKKDTQHPAKQAVECGFTFGTSV